MLRQTAFPELRSLLGLPGLSTASKHITPSLVELEMECVVCGAPATAVHYMAWTCNGCKTFFRRAIMENRRYSCSRKGHCAIRVPNRCTCRHCRLQKCFRKGMKFTEVNLDRKRRLRLDNGALVHHHLKHSAQTGGGDPLLCALLLKETRFRVLLLSDLTPIHGDLELALRTTTNAFGQPSGQHIQQSEARMNFHDWRSRTLSIIVEWAKSFHEFKQFLLADQKALVVHSAFALLALSEAFHTPERYSDRLVYPNGLQLTRNFAKSTGLASNGLNGAMVAVINDILVPIRRMRLTEAEYVLLMGLLFFDPDCLALSDQTVCTVKAIRRRLLDCLDAHLGDRFGARNAIGRAERKAQLLLRIPKIQIVASFKRTFYEGHQSTGLANEIAMCYPNMSFF